MSGRSRSTAANKEWPRRRKWPVVLGYLLAAFGLLCGVGLLSVGWSIYQGLSYPDVFGAGVVIDSPKSTRVGSGFRGEGHELEGRDAAALARIFNRRVPFAEGGGYAVNDDTSPMVWTFWGDDPGYVSVRHYPSQGWVYFDESDGRDMLADHAYGSMADVTEEDLTSLLAVLLGSGLPRVEAECRVLPWQVSHGNLGPPEAVSVGFAESAGRRLTGTAAAAAARALMKLRPDAKNAPPRDGDGWSASVLIEVGREPRPDRSTARYVQFDADGHRVRLADAEYGFPFEPQRAGPSVLAGPELSDLYVDFLNARQ